MSFLRGDLETHVNVSDSSPTLSVGKEAFNYIYISTVAIRRSHRLPLCCPLSLPSSAQVKETLGTERFPSPPKVSVLADLQWNKDCLSAEMLMRNPTCNGTAAI